MKKWILFLSTFAVIIFTCFGSYIYLYRAEFTSTALSNLYGTPVKVSKIKVTKEAIELQNITVYNPSEYTMQPALHIPKIAVKVTPIKAALSLLGYSPITIRKISVVDAELGIEVPNTKELETNWIKLLSNLGTNTQSSLPSRLFTIETLVVRDIAIQIKNKALHKHSLRPPSISRITLEANQETAPQSLESIIYWATKATLAEVGQQIDQNDFSVAINEIPAPEGHENPLKLTPKK